MMSSTSSLGNLLLLAILSHFSYLSDRHHTMKDEDCLVAFEES